MKYGRYLMNYLKNDSFLDEKNAIANLGDSIQSLAIDSIYEQLGVPPESIRYIKRDFAAEYDGDTVSLVIYTEFVKNMVSHRMTISPKIHVKSAVSTVFYEDFDQLNLAYPKCYKQMKKWAPIGARDEKSLNILRKNGIEAYLTGCFTICFPKRETEPKTEKVFFVDTPKELEPYIPVHIKPTIEYLTHAEQIKKYPVDEDENLRLETKARNLLERYRNEATLVVTGRLHAAIPCIAMGIPVILAANNLDFRFEWIDKLIYPYQFDEFENIDWNPKALDVEEIKSHFINYFACVLNDRDPRPDMKWLNDFYMDRNRIKPYRYFRSILSALKGKYSQNDCFSYVIWGAGFHCDYAFMLMKEMYPNAKLIAVVDKFKKGTFQGIPIIRELELCNFNFEHLIISTAKGKEDAIGWVTLNRPYMEYSLIISSQKS